MHDPEDEFIVDVDALDTGNGPILSQHFGLTKNCTHMHTFPTI